MFDYAPHSHEPHGTLNDDYISGWDPTVEPWGRGMKEPETIEEELAIIAEALNAGIDPFPPKKESSGLIRLGLGWFMIIIMVSWVSQLLYRSI